MDSWNIRVKWEGDGLNAEILRKYFATFSALDVIMEKNRPDTIKSCASVTFLTYLDAYNVQLLSNGTLINGTSIEVTLD